MGALLPSSKTCFDLLIFFDVFLKVPESRIQKLLKLLNTLGSLVDLLLCSAEFLPPLLVLSKRGAVYFVVLVADHAHRHLRDA